MKYIAKIRYNSKYQLRYIEKKVSHIEEECLSIVVQHGFICIESKQELSSQTLENLNSFENELELDDELFCSFNSGSTKVNQKVFYDVIDFEYGKIGYRGELLKLRTNICRFLETISGGFEQRHYPSLMGNEHMKMTGYLEKSKHHAIKATCDSSESCYLTPSSCFHTYQEFKGQSINSNKSISFTQHVFREEGKFAYNQPWRLKDFYVKECVFIGDSDFVESQLEKLFQQLVEYLEGNGIVFKVYYASDPFVDIKLQKLRAIQVKTKVKKEVRIICGDEEISIASFNLHGFYFSERFNINMLDGSRPQTACVGFGIDRILLGMGLQGVGYE